MKTGYYIKSNDPITGIVTIAIMELNNSQIRALIQCLEDRSHELPDNCLAIHNSMCSFDKGSCKKC